MSIYLGNALPGALQGCPPVSGVGLLLAPESGSQGEGEEGEPRPREQKAIRAARGRTAPHGPWSPHGARCSLGSGTGLSVHLSHQLFFILKGKYLSSLTQFSRAHHHDFHISCQDNLLNRGMDAVT